MGKINGSVKWRLAGMNVMGAVECAVLKSVMSYPKAVNSDTTREFLALLKRAYSNTSKLAVKHALFVRIPDGNA